MTYVLIAAGLAAAVAVVALGPRLLARRRAAVTHAALDAKGAITEEYPRLRNGRRLTWILSHRAHRARLVRVPAPTVVRYRITERGHPREAMVLRSSGMPAFDQVVLDALRYARFAPARVNGRPVQVWVEQPFTFRASADHS